MSSLNEENVLGRTPYETLGICSSCRAPWCFSLRGVWIISYCSPNFSIVHLCLQTRVTNFRQESSHPPISPCFPFYVIHFHLFPTFSIPVFVPLISDSLPLSYLSSSSFFLKEVCESAITETPSFSAQAAKFILVVFRMFILGFLEGRHICGKTKRPGAGAFPLGIIAAQGKNRKVFFGKWN